MTRSHCRLLHAGLLAILLAVVGGYAAPAGAAQLTELSYEITGQLFGELRSGATVMGGTVTLTPKEGSLTTPCSYDALCLSYLAHGSGGFTIALTVTGSDSQGHVGDLLIGWGTLVPQTLGGPFSPGGSGYAFITPDAVTIVDFEGGSVRQHDVSPYDYSLGPVYDVADFGLQYAGGGTLFISATDRFFDYGEADYVTNFIFVGLGLGNEVRTTVPEPAPSALVELALGLIVLAGGGAWLRRRRDVM